jgi:RNA-directed DNA polymerase
VSFSQVSQSTERKELTEMTRQYQIPQSTMEEAWRLVKANKGAAGIDGQTVEDFEKDLENNLYKIWNRMTSGSYFPSAVRTVYIPKSSGGQRMLGIPTVASYCTSYRFPSG